MWHLVDARGQVVGRVAPRIAHLLRGKGKPYYVSHLDCGDYVVVVNISDVAVTGKKEQQKTYTRYSGYPSGLRTETLDQLRRRKPTDIIRHAVAGMLPKNKLRKRWLSHLYLYAGADHPYGDRMKAVVESPNTSVTE